MKEITNNEVVNSMNTYIENNRTKLDEILVSLRLMKEIDDFLCLNNINQRDFADKIGCSESFISQLMTGTKKFNAAFINKFENVFDMKINFKIVPKNNHSTINKIANEFIKINIINQNGVIGIASTFVVESKTNEFLMI